MGDITLEKFQSLLTENPMFNITLGNSKACLRKIPWVTSLSEIPKLTENPKLTMFFLFPLNRFLIVCSNCSASDTLAGGMYLSGNCTYRESQSQDDWEGCSSMVREEFIRHAERHMQDWPAGSFDFRAESSPSPPPTPRHPREPPRAEKVRCVTQSRDEEKAWVRSNTGVLLHSGGGFDKAVYQEMQRPFGI